MASEVPQGPVVLHAGHTARPHPPAVRLRRTGTGGRLTRQRSGTGKRPTDGHTGREAVAKQGAGNSARPRNGKASHEGFLFPPLPPPRASCSGEFIRLAGG